MKFSRRFLRKKWAFQTIENFLTGAERFWNMFVTRSLNCFETTNDHFWIKWPSGKVTILFPWSFEANLLHWFQEQPWHQLSRRTILHSEQVRRRLQTLTHNLSLKLFEQPLKTDFLSIMWRISTSFSLQRRFDEQRFLNSEFLLIEALLQTLDICFPEFSRMKLCEQQKLWQ